MTHSEPSAQPLTVTCTNESIFGRALSYGRSYVVLGRNETKSHIRVRGDNSRTRWYPEHCFDMAGGAVPLIDDFRVWGDSADSFCLVQVEVRLTDGSRRLCVFATPEMLAQRIGCDVGHGRLLLYGTTPMVIVTAITREIVGESLTYIQGQGDLMMCSLPWDADG